MTSDSDQQENPSLRPMNEPHIPISENEMNPNLHNENPSSSRNLLLTLAIGLVLVGIVGVTLFLYIFNTTRNTTHSVNKLVPTQSPTVNIPTKTDQVTNSNPSIPDDPNCKRLTSMDDALKDPEKVCYLDLSSKNLEKIPPSISKFSNLTTLSLSNNSFTDFPIEVLSLKSLIRLQLAHNNLKTIPTKIAQLTNLKVLDISNNRLTTIPDELITLNLANLILINNNFSDNEISRIKKLFANTKINLLLSESTK